MTTDTPAASSNQQHARKLSSTNPPSSYLVPSHPRARILSHGPAERARPVLSQTSTGIVVDGYASDGDNDRRSKSFFNFRPRSKTENRSVDEHGHGHANRGAETLELESGASHLRDNSNFQTTRSPLYRDHDNYENQNLENPAAAHGDTELAGHVPTLPWKLPTLLAHQHNSQTSSASMEHLISPSDLNIFQFNVPDSVPPLPPPTSEESGRNTSEMGSRRPSTASGALDNGAHFSRESSVVANLSSRNEIVTEVRSSSLGGNVSFIITSS